MVRMLFVLPVLALGLAAGCADKGASPLAGTQWRVTAIDGEAPAQPGVAKVAFEKDKVAVSLGCNHIGGAYRVDGQRLIAGPFVTTEKACDQRLGEQEAAVGALLEAAPLFSQQGARLRLDSGGHALDLVKAG